MKQRNALALVALAVVAPMMSGASNPYMLVGAGDGWRITMSDSLGEIFWVAAEGEGSGFGVVYEHRHGDLKTRTERGARAVALHVLEQACPESPILEAMRQGMSFEEALERFDVKALEALPLERSFRSALELIGDSAIGDPAALAKAVLARQENLRRHADEHPTPEQIEAGRKRHGSTMEVEKEIVAASEIPNGRHRAYHGDPTADRVDDGPISGRDVDEGHECIEGYPSPGAGFCRGLGSPPKSAV